MADTAEKDPFSAPDSGYGPKAEALVGKLLLLTPTKHREGIVTANGVKDSVDGDLVIINENDPTQSEQTKFGFMQGKLIAALKDRIGKGPVLGRMAMGEAKPGQNKPYVLEPYTAEDAAKAKAYLASVDPFA